MLMGVVDLSLDHPDGAGRSCAGRTRRMAWGVSRWRTSARGGDRTTGLGAEHGEPPSTGVEEVLVEDRRRGGGAREVRRRRGGPSALVLLA
jgi:hypothetical protein